MRLISRNITNLWFAFLLLFFGIRLCLICFPREETSPIVHTVSGAGYIVVSCCIVTYIWLQFPVFSLITSLFSKIYCIFIGFIKNIILNLLDASNFFFNKQVFLQFWGRKLFPCKWRQKCVKCPTTSHFEHIYAPVHTLTSEYNLRRMTDMYERVSIGIGRCIIVNSLGKSHLLPGEQIRLYGDSGFRYWSLLFCLDLSFMI